jgi:two-component system LytT family response regulator
MKMNPKRTLIIDDEKLARDRMARLMTDHADRFTIVGKADSGPEAVRQINEVRPDLVLLDIEMPGLDGFEVLASVEELPLVIFVTAFNDFALKAFEVNAVDYLVKPIRPERLAHALDRIPESPPSTDLIMQLLQANTTGKATLLERISIRKGNRILFWESSDISFFKSEDKYTFAVGEQGEEIIGQTLTELEKRLDPSLFVRIHRGYLINRRFLMEIRRDASGAHQAIVLCPNPMPLPVSRNGLKNLL